MLENIWLEFQISVVSVHSRHIDHIHFQDPVESVENLVVNSNVDEYIQYAV